MHDIEFMASLAGATDAPVMDAGNNWITISPPHCDQLDRDVVAESQIRTIIRAYRDHLFTDLFPNCTRVTKTIVFAV